MVEVEVDEVFRAQEGWPTPGSHVFYEQRRGEIHIRGHRICEHTSSGLETFRAVPGQRVLVGGRGRSYSPPVVLGAAAWEITASGEIVPQPYTFVQPTRIDVGALRTAGGEGK
jgi:hypothetical protein